MKRHPFDPWSFTLGLLFLAAGLAFLTDSVDLLNTNIALLWTIPLLAIGFLIVFTSVRRVRQRPSPLEAEVALADDPDAAPDGHL